MFRSWYCIQGMLKSGGPTRFTISANSTTGVSEPAMGSDYPNPNCQSGEDPEISRVVDTTLNVIAVFLVQKGQRD